MGRKIARTVLGLLVAANVALFTFGNPLGAAEEAFLCEGVCDCMWTTHSMNCVQWIHDGCDWGADCAKTD